LARNKRWLVWVLVILFALSDEYHQSFVAGRYSSIWDVLVFDNIGALLSLGLTSLNLNKKKKTTRQ
jgi:VanZ family protein